MKRVQIKVVEARNTSLPPVTLDGDDGSVRIKSGGGLIVTISNAAKRTIQTYAYGSGEWITATMDESWYDA